jgi:hypothetical protein
MCARLLDHHPRLFLGITSIVVADCDGIVSTLSRSETRVAFDQQMSSQRAPSFPIGNPVDHLAQPAHTSPAAARA